MPVSMLPASRLTARLTGWPAGWSWLPTILALSAALRCGVGFFAGLEHVKPDTPSYLKMADAILAGAPLSDFPNGFPLILAALKLVVGNDMLIPAMVGLNIGLSTATVLFVYLIFRQVFGGQLAVIAALLVAVWPNQLNYVPQVLSEVPCGFLLAAGLWAFGGGRLVLAGALICCAGLVRMTVMPVVPLLVLILFWDRRRHEAVRFAFGFGLVYGANLAAQAVGIIAAPSNLAINLLVSIGSTSTQGIDFDLVRFTADERTRPLATHLWFAFEHPASYAIQRLSALWEMWGPWPSNGAPFSDRGPVTRAMIGLRFPLIVLAAIAAWHYRRRRDVLALCVPVLVLTALHTAFFANARFSYPVEPLLAVLAVAGARVMASGTARIPAQRAFS